MIDEIIIHIGMNKTGVPAYRSICSITKMKPQYLQTSPILECHKALIIQAFSITFFQKKQKPFISQKDCEDLICSQISRNPKKLIFSAETISLFNDSEKINLENFMMRFTKKLKIFAYIRSPLDFATSAFQERIKTGLNYIPNTISPNYKKRFEYWRISKKC